MIPDKRLVWHPRRDDRFVVGGGTQITLYELAGEYPEIRHVTSRHDLHHMRCFAWSPDSQLDDLVAVGTTTGRVDLIRLQASARHNHNSIRSQTPSSLLSDPHSRPSSVLSAGPTIPLSVRNSRACNSLAFSTANPNYLAVGLDKVRGDPSLVVWDLATTTPLLQIPGETWPLPSPAPSPLHNVSLPTPTLPYPAVPLPRVIESQHSSRTDSRIVQQHATGEVVSALAFIPGTAHLLLAGISNRHFRFFDLRGPFTGLSSGSPNSSATPSTDAMSSPSSYATASTSNVSNVSGGNSHEHWRTGSSSSSTSGNGSTIVPAVSYRASQFHPPAGVVTSPSIPPYQTPRLSHASYTPASLTFAPPALGKQPTGAEIANVQVKVVGISPDPLEPHRVACWNGDEGIVMIWDARKLKEPVLIFGERDALADGGYHAPGYEGTGECPVCGAYGPHQHSDGRRGGIGGHVSGSGAGSGVYVQAEWATARRGTIATLERDSRFVRVWDVLSARPYMVETVTHGSGGVTGGGGGGSRAGIRRSWAATLSWPRSEGGGSGDSPQSTYSPFGSGEFYGSTYNSPLTLILSDTRRTKSFTKALSSFALVPPSVGVLHDITTKIMVVNKEGDLELYAMHDAPKQAVWSARGDLAVSGGSGAKVVTQTQEEVENGEVGDGSGVGKVLEKPASARRGRQEADIHRPSISRNVSGSYLPPGPTLAAIGSKKAQEDKEVRERDKEMRKTEAKKKATTVVRVVQEDISMVMKQRAMRGYGIGRPDHNRAVVREVDDTQGSSGSLTELWLWIHRSHLLLSLPNPEVNGYDFSYQGLSAIWEGFPPNPNEPLTMYVPAHAKTRIAAAAARQLYSQQGFHGSNTGPNPPYYPGLTTQKHTPTSTPIATSLTQTPTLTSATLQYQQQLQMHQQMQMQLLQQHGHKQERSSGHDHSPTLREEYDPRYSQQYSNDYEYTTNTGRGSLLLNFPPEHHHEEPFGGLQPQVQFALRSRSPVGSVMASSTEVNISSGDASLHEGSGSDGSPAVASDLADSMVGPGAGTWGASGVAGTVKEVLQSGYRDQAYQVGLQAILTRSSRTRGEPMNWRPTVPTQKALQRHVALLLCGWSVDQGELMNVVRRWEKEGSFPRAACWLVFMKEYDKAIELLMRSNDEAHRMMSGTLAALLPSVLATSTSSPGAQSADLRAHCERLIHNLHDPYFRALLTHLTLGDWSEVLDEESLPFLERLAIAFQFLEDRALSSYLKLMVEQATSRGSIDSIILTGLRCRAGMDILQSYVDRTGDVQSAAILSALTWPSYYAQQQSPIHASSTLPSGRHGHLGYTSGQALDARPEKWLEAYRDLLDGFKLFHCRVGFDIERGQVMNAAIQNGDIVMGHGGGSGAAGAGEWIPGQIMIRCRYCGKTVNGPGVGVGVVASQSSLGKPTLCPHCNRQLPRCSICLMTLGIVYDAGRDSDMEHSFRDTTDNAIVICQTCRHGGHSAHIMEWFWTEDGKQNHETCAVADCNCRCADES